MLSQISRGIQKGAFRAGKVTKIRNISQNQCYSSFLSPVFRKPSLLEQAA